MSVIEGFYSPFVYKSKYYCMHCSLAFEGRHQGTAQHKSFILPRFCSDLNVTHRKPLFKLTVNDLPFISTYLWHTRCQAITILKPVILHFLHILPLKMSNDIWQASKSNCHSAGDINFICNVEALVIKANIFFRIPFKLSALKSPHSIDCVSFIDECKHDYNIRLVAFRTLTRIRLEVGFSNKLIQ